MSLLSRLFGGGGSTTNAASESYEGFRITPKPERVGTRFRVGALIEKEIDGETRSHHLIRADILDDIDGANAASLGKARQMIDEQGDRLFD